MKMTMFAALATVALAVMASIHESAPPDLLASSSCSSPIISPNVDSTAAPARAQLSFGAVTPARVAPFVDTEAIFERAAPVRHLAVGLVSKRPAGVALALKNSEDITYKSADSEPEPLSHQG